MMQVQREVPHGATLARGIPGHTVVRRVRRVHIAGVLAQSKDQIPHAHRGELIGQVLAIEGIHVGEGYISNIEVDGLADSVVRLSKAADFTTKSALGRKIYVSCDRNGPVGKPVVALTAPLPGVRTIGAVKAVANWPA